jgi:L-fuconolactonase
MKIDAHQHFWQYEPLRDAWINDNMQVIRRDFGPDDLLPTLQANGIEGCVAVQADQSETETDFLLDLAQQHAAIKGVVGWVDLRAENLVQRLEYYAQFSAIKGFRHIVQAETDELFMLRTEFSEGIRALQGFGFTYDILIYPHQLRSARELVARFANQPFVLDHLAKPYIKQGLIDKWKQDLQALARHDNVLCKVSGMVTEADWEYWDRDDLRPYLDAAFEAFGPDRLMFGSDWPVCLVAASYEQWVGVLEAYLSEFSDSEKAKFWGENARRFYRL